jgi:protein involved in polysaccharide export with SLBB domain
MKATSLFALPAVWIFLSLRGSAQMSTFPSPPPLAPLPPPATEQPQMSLQPAPETADAASASDKKTGEAPAAPTSASPANITAGSLSSMTALDDKVALEAGDTVSFRVIEDRDAPLTRIVTDTGEVDFPYIGRVKVEGKTCHQVAVEVKKLLEVDYYKQATVIVGLDLIIGQDKTKAKEMAWVVGQVRQVGPVELVKAQPITVSQAIMRAGGFGEFADQRKVKLIHRGAQSGDEAQANLSKAKDFQVVDIKSVFEGKSVLDPILREGDYIIVPKQFVNF